MAKIPDARLQALHDGLRLLQLLTTESRPFDQLADVATRVRWYGLGRLAAQLRAALEWVEKRAREQRVALRRNDCEGVPEQPYRVWHGSFTP
jgi:hypothetical protein